MRQIRPYLMLAACALVAGCVSNPAPQFPGDKVSMKNASEDNVSLGIKYLQAGKRDVAMQKIQKAIQQDPDNADAYMGEALIYGAMGDTERADDAYRTALRKAPDDPEIQNNYAVFLCQHDKAAESEKYFLKAATNPNYSTPDAAYSNAGLCAALVPDPVAAEKFFRKAIDVNPNLPEPLYQMAALSYKQKKYLQARAFIERFNSVTPQQRPDAMYQAIEIERALGDQTGAAEIAKQLIKQFPASAEAQQLQGGAHGGHPG